MAHERIDPAGRIGGAERSILGPKDQVEASPRGDKPALSKQPGDGRLKRIGRLAESCQSGWFRKPATPLGKLLVEKFLEVTHASIISEKQRFVAVFQYDPGGLGTALAGRTSEFRTCRRQQHVQKTCRNF
ncbi:MAG: hypothetical protein HQ464_16700 [Planctomycetes bacterium]|nr:hypothetical protein [Planctomycetota bacterium]